MAKPEPVHSQTVEEILASIRQAISEDETRRGVQRPRPAAGPEPANGVAAPAAANSEADDERPADPRTRGVVDLAIEQALHGVKAELEAEAEAADADESPAPAPRPGLRPLARPAPRVEPRHQTPPRHETRGPLMSPRAGAAVSASFDTLTKQMSPSGSRKLEELVEAMLRPMLRSWLDDNLPTLVERLVREEIERVSRARR